MKHDGFDLQEIDIYCLFAHAVLAIVPHHFKRESYDKSVLSILQKLLGQICLLHVVKMEEQVFAIYVRYYEAITLAFIKELQSSCDSVIKVLHVWIIWIRIDENPLTLDVVQILNL